MSNGDLLARAETEFFEKLARHGFAGQALGLRIALAAIDGAPDRASAIVAIRSAARIAEQCAAGDLATDTAQRMVALAAGVRLSK